MNKVWLSTAALCLLAAAAAGSAGAEEAASPPQPVVTIQSGGQLLPGYTIFINKGGVSTAIAAEAYEKNGVVMVPLRQVAEQLGYTVVWDDEHGCADLETGVAYMHIYPGIDMYERMGTLKVININRIYQYGCGAENVGGVLYVPARMFEAFYNDVSFEAGSLVISPLEIYLQADGGAS